MTRGGPIHEHRTVRACGKPLRGRRSDTRYCSASCKQAARRARGDTTGLPAGGVAAPNGNGNGHGSGDLTELAARVRRTLAVLADGRATLSAGEARWCEQTRRLLSDSALIERLESAEVRIAQRHGAIIAKIITVVLADFGIDVADAEVGPAVARHAPRGSRANRRVR